MSRIDAIFEQLRQDRHSALVIFITAGDPSLEATADLAPQIAAAGADWPQWGGCDGRNMVSQETGLADSFVPGEKKPRGGGIDLATTKNVKWATG